jgi:hypothetical protein
MMEATGAHGHHLGMLADVSETVSPVAGESHDQPPGEPRARTDRIGLCARSSAERAKPPEYGGLQVLPPLT